LYHIASAGSDAIIAPMQTIAPAVLDQQRNQNTVYLDCQFVLVQASAIWRLQYPRERVKRGGRGQVVHPRWQQPKAYRYVIRLK